MRASTNGRNNAFSATALRRGIYPRICDVAYRRGRRGMKSRAIAAAIIAELLAAGD